MGALALIGWEALTKVLPLLWWALGKAIDISGYLLLMWVRGAWDSGERFAKEGLFKFAQDLGPSRFDSVVLSATRATVLFMVLAGWILASFITVRLVELLVWVIF
jgi:hypothetical protein